MKTEIIAIVNQKGGVGKSTTTFNLGVGLSLRGFKVLFVDLDAQGNLTDTAKGEAGELSVWDLFTKKAKIKEVIQHCEKWDVIASSPFLAGADIELSGKGKEHLLRNALELIRDRYDYILIDTPPALGVLMSNALTASTGVIIPAQADRYSLKSIAQLHATIGTIKRYSNSNLIVKGILLTRYSGRAVLTRDLTEVIVERAREMGTKVFKSKIREAIAVKESQAQREDIFTYAPKSNVAKDYNAFIDELLRS